MSEINRMLRQLDQQDALGELTLQMPPPEPARSADPAPTLAAGAATSMATALHAAATARSAASGLAADLSAGPAPAQPRPATAQAPGRWRLPALALVGAGAIAAVVLTNPSTAPSGETAAAGTTSAAEPATSADATPAATQAAPATQAPPPAAVLAVAPAAPPAPAAPVALPARPVAQAPARPARAAPAPAIAAAPKAEPALEQVVALPPPLLTPSGAARIDKRTVAPTAEQRAKALMHAAMEQARTGQRQAALQRAQEALAIEPRHVPARQLAAVLHYEAGNPALALGLLREGVGLEGAPPTLALLLARLLAHQNLGPEALAVLDRHGLDSAEAEGLRAGLLAQQGAYGRALVAYENALRQQPAQATLWVGMAVALESEGQPARARQAYAQARHLGLSQADLASYVEQRLRALE